MSVDQQVAAALRNQAAAILTQANLLDPPVTPPVTSPPVVPGAGGTVITPNNFVGRIDGDPSVWVTAFEENFPNLAPKGQFLQTYSRWGGYPTNYQTTDKQGHYDPAQVSVIDTADGLRVQNVDLTPGSQTRDGRPVSAAMYPSISSQGDCRSLGMRVFQRRRFINPHPNWHVANLFWPVDEVWPSEGEIDFDEEDIISTSSGAFFHNMGATSGSDQVPESAKIDGTQWHIIGVEWLAGRSIKWFVDNQQVGPTITSRVPSKMMRLVDQIENNGLPAQASAVQYDWQVVQFPK